MQRLFFTIRHVILLIYPLLLFSVYFLLQCVCYDLKDYWYCCVVILMSSSARGRMVDECKEAAGTVCNSMMWLV